VNSRILQVGGGLVGGGLVGGGLVGGGLVGGGVSPQSLLVLHSFTQVPEEGHF